MGENSYAAWSLRLSGMQAVPALAPTPNCSCSRLGPCGALLQHPGRDMPTDEEDSHCPQQRACDCHGERCEGLGRGRKGG